MHAAAKYRPDIDGLRALAVLPVVFYHFRMNSISGGFIGVDVFFVISGYLITQVIYADVTAGTYTVAGFYERRIRRILPAYIFVALCAAVVMAMVGLPSEVSAFRDSLAAATLFASNIYFYITADYFDAGSEAQPLLHTWSLAVEEQFYILFPILLWAVRHRSRRQVLILIVVLAIASLGISAFLVHQNRSAAFYLLHSRAWELLLGSFLAIGLPQAPSSRMVREGMAGLGLVLIVACVFIYDVATPFPGFAALVPCIGAALILQSGGGSTVGRLLSLWPVRFIGLISYSLYLWHWPVWVLAKSYFLLDPTRLTKVGLVLLCIGLATFSWWFVERPFRTRPFKLRRPELLFSGAASICLLLGASMLLPAANSQILRLPPGADRVLATADDLSVRRMREGTCFLTSTSNDFDSFDKSGCLQLASGKKNVLLVGDSHGAHLWAGLAGASPDINVLQATASGCKPVRQATGLERCTRLMRFIFEQFLPAHHMDEIIISGRWTPQDVDAAVETAEMLKQYADRVVIFGPTVEYKIGLPKLVVLAAARNDAGLVDRNRLQEQKNVDAMFKAKVENVGVSYFSVYDAICSEGACQVLDHQALPLEFDYGHLTINGSTIVARKALQSGMLPVVQPPSPAGTD